MRGEHSSTPIRIMGQNGRSMTALEVEGQIQAKGYAQ